MNKNQTQQLDRRQFVGRSALLAGGALVAATAPCCAALTSPLSSWENAEPWFKVSLAQWSLHRMLQKGKLDNLGFPAYAKEQFQIEAVEYVSQFFKDKVQDQRYLGELNKRCSDAGVKSLLIMVDGEGAIGNPRDAKRKRAVENHHKWVAAARELGCHSIRVNASSKGGYQEQANLVVDGLSRLCEIAAPYEINVAVENHGGLSSNGQWLAQVIKKVGMDNCGTLPDFGNFKISKGVVYDPYVGVAALLPFAKAVSAKSYGFDEAGNETKTDFLKMMTMVKDSGYRGYVGIEFEGKGISEIEGIEKTRDLLIRTREQLS